MDALTSPPLLVLALTPNPNPTHRWSRCAAFLCRGSPQVRLVGYGPPPPRLCVLASASLRRLLQRSCHQLSACPTGVWSRTSLCCVMRRASLSRSRAVVLCTSTLGTKPQILGHSDFVLTWALAKRCCGCCVDWGACTWPLRVGDLVQVREVVAFLLEYGLRTTGELWSVL